jgi:hypothetical protein
VLLCCDEPGTVVCDEILPDVYAVPVKNTDEPGVELRPVVP